MVSEIGLERPLAERDSLYFGGPFSCRDDQVHRPGVLMKILGGIITNGYVTLLIFKA
jgi:hypothetical protein